jgi:hypothetical protein
VIVILVTLVVVVPSSSVTRSVNVSLSVALGVP